MDEEIQESRTRLEQILRQRNMTLEDLRAGVRKLSGNEVSQRQAYRWVSGELRGRPHPHASAALTRIFDEPIHRLLGPAYGVAGRAAPNALERNDRGSARPDWKGQLIAMSADRARNFLSFAEASNVGAGSLEQFADDVRLLVTATDGQPVPAVLPDVIAAQEYGFNLLQGRQRPAHTRDLYFLTGVVTGLLAKAAHDLGAPHDALTHARTAYACADNADHDGLRAWVCGLQSLICYWAGRFNDAVAYARKGAESAGHGTAAVRVAANEARALAALNRVEDARAALHRASAAQEDVRSDEVDELGGLCSFGRPQQLYYAADALAWAGQSTSAETERYAVDALAALDTAGPTAKGGFGNTEGARCDLAIARLASGELEGAAEALVPVLALPRERRQQGILRSVERVRSVLREQPSATSQPGRELDESMEVFMSHRLALPGQ
ncbi:hypothetical protein [Actinokineospora enzanensis]|uniref:hypothetical protein n=1 Tax=Actinokineospora enzanensis TaxID=155975 RepID=UPI00036BF242|nr:hypothetical protein [Actinokineospora enzanensis]